MPYKDKQKRLESHERWRIKNRGPLVERQRKRRVITREWFKGYKKNFICIKCLESDPRCIDFHHQEGNKELSIANMVSGGYSKERILKELKKCTPSVPIVIERYI